MAGISQSKAIVALHCDPQRPSVALRQARDVPARLGDLRQDGLGEVTSL